MALVNLHVPLPPPLELDDLVAALLQRRTLAMSRSSIWRFWRRRTSNRIGASIG